ncbi:MAG: protease modulator HflK [Lentisphaerae bacterium]|nr:protease modulator HflK [Lentisphaerota bacterium]
MENKEDFKRTDDRARLLTKLSVIGGIGSLVLLAAVLILSAKRGGDMLGLAAVPYAVSLFFSVMALIYGILYGAVQREDEEKRLLAKRMESRALNVDEDVRFTAGRSFSNFTRFAPFVIAVIAVVIIGLMLWRSVSMWNLREGAPVTMSGSPVHTALISAVLMMVSVFAGAFMVGQSRMPGFRWLRPVGAWLLVGFLTLFAAAVSAVFFGNNITAVDPVISRVFFWIFVILGAEFVVNFVIEFYRPRTLGESRPVFESQLLALFTEPGGVLRNIASALDYQFGFKVSGTWIYGFIERSFFPVLILWAVLLWGFTTVHEVGPNNVGVREQFGKAMTGEILEPGIYWTLPYPFGTVRQFSCTEIKTLIIGENEEKNSGNAEKASPVVLWTNAHGGAKEPFLMAVETVGDKSNESSSVSFINMMIPIGYRIRKDGVIKYAYGNASPEVSLKMLGEQVVIEYLAGETIDNFITNGRGKAERTLKENLQKLADSNRLGVEIVRVSIMDAHPPVEQVAPAYQNVVAALEEKETQILKAKAYKNTVIPAANAEAFKIENDALSRKENAAKIAKAESERFDSQLKAFRSMKGMFMLNARMDVWENEGLNIQKYLVPAELKDMVYQINFEKSERLDLIDIDASDLTDKR